MAAPASADPVDELYEGETEDFIPCHFSRSAALREQFPELAAATLAAGARPLEPAVLREGDALIVMHSQGRSFAKAGEKNTVRLKKQNVPLNTVLGKPPGRYYELDKGGKLVFLDALPESETKITGTLVITAFIIRRFVDVIVSPVLLRFLERLSLFRFAVVFCATTDEFIPTASNRELTDDASNQTLTPEEIEELKKEAK